LIFAFAFTIMPIIAMSADTMEIMPVGYRFLVEPVMEYDATICFHNGTAVVEKNGKYGYINKTGELVVPLIYDYAFYCSDGVGCVQKDGKWGIIEFLRVGDKLGSVLYSNITAYIDGQAIPTSNINNRTMVVVEDLANYGFKVKWDCKERTLKVELNKNKKFKPLEIEKDMTVKSGDYKCDYFYTDIKTYLSGEEVESYNINGRTFINFELLKKYGKVTWDGKARELRLVTDCKNNKK